MPIYFNIRNFEVPVWHLKYNDVIPVSELRSQFTDLKLGQKDFIHQINALPMNELQTIQNKIFTLRGKQVMLDKDLAELYGVTTGNLNKAVKRNLNRFPEDFMFRLTKEEYESLIFQIGISKGRGGNRFLPYAFTEQGVAMLSSVLNSETAIQINIGIIRAFVEVRKMLAEPSTDKFSVLENRIKKLEDYMEEILSDQNDINEETSLQIDAIYKALENLQEEAKKKTERPKIGFITDKSNS